MWLRGEDRGWDGWDEWVRPTAELHLKFTAYQLAGRGP